MPLKYGSTTVQNVIYNNTQLRKVYFKNGTANPVLVFATPTIYNGGDGTSLFGSKSFVYYMQRANTYNNSSTYSSFTPSTMYGTVARQSSGSSYHYGICIIVGNDTFDISQYSSLTFTYDVTSGSSQDRLGVTIRCGLSTQCERRGTDPANQTYYNLAGTQYDTQISGIMQGTGRSQTLNLTNAKANGSLYYPFLSIVPSNLSNARNETWGVTIKSIILS